MHQPITALPDGTIKQVSPFNGTHVWTVPGRALRPFINHDLSSEPIDWNEDGRFCSFCSHRYLDSPPEKARLVRLPVPDDAPDEQLAATASRPAEGYRLLSHVGAADLDQTIAAFRLVPNLFPILPLGYWQANHARQLSPAEQAWRAEYLADPAGRAHLLLVSHRLAQAKGLTDSQWNGLTELEQLAASETFFASSHDLIIGHRHFSSGALSSTELASSGTLTPDEHAAYIDFTARSALDLLSATPGASYVTIFQNWLRAAGASFDHLHKQLAAIDQLPAQHHIELENLRHHPDLYRRYGVDYAQQQKLVIAHNRHAVAFAGYGHRYPAIEVHSLSASGRPWELSDAELRSLSDLVHAIHVATGTQTPCNEEWYYQPPEVAEWSPVRVVVKWRVSTLAGFEGATKIYLNTISPWDLRDRVTGALATTTAAIGDLTVD